MSKIKLAELRAALVSNGYELSVEDLFSYGFPPSAAYPAYWYAANTGARLAATLFPGAPMRVQFYRKVMQVRFVPMTDVQYARHLEAVEETKRAARVKNAYIKDFIARTTGED